MIRDGRSGAAALAAGAADATPARRLPWLRIAAMYLAARAVTTGFFLVAAALAPADSRFGASPSLADFVLGWDAQWYWQVAFSGYPAELPLDAAGRVTENAWAFMPLYAWLAQIVGLGSFGVGALLVSLVAGYLSCVVLYGLLRERQDAPTACWATVFHACGPLAAMFQVGYAESLFLLLLLAALWATTRRRWWWLYPLVPALGFTRPGVLAFALFLGLYGVWRWLRRRRDPLPAAEVCHILVLGALATAVGFSWQVIVGAVTGDSGGYLATELAWRAGWLGHAATGFVPFEGWIQAAGVWFGIWGLPAWLGQLALAVLVACAVAALFSPPVRRLGVEIRLWAASYLVYLLAVFFPQSSTVRLLLPLSPLWGAAVPRRLYGRVLVLVLCLAAQWWWLWNMYGLGNTFWQIP